MAYLTKTQKQWPQPLIKPYLDPQRISPFGYAHVPWMQKHMRLIDEKTLPQELRLSMFMIGSQKLKEAGYEAIGIDHFARPNDPLAIATRDGTLRRNFQGYTTDTAETMIGIGASSIGQFTEGYIQNCVDMPAYKSYSSRKVTRTKVLNTHKR